MKSRFLNRTNALLLAILFLYAANQADAANASFSTTAPTLGPDDIANLTGASGLSGNVASGIPEATYLADDRPVQGTDVHHWPESFRLSADRRDASSRYIFDLCAGAGFDLHHPNHFARYR
jgi:hypothetical protein